MISDHDTFPCNDTFPCSGYRIMIHFRAVVAHDAWGCSMSRQTMVANACCSGNDNILTRGGPSAYDCLLCDGRGSVGRGRGLSTGYGMWRIH